MLFPEQVKELIAQVTPCELKWKATGIIFSPRLSRLRLKAKRGWRAIV